MFSFYDRLNSDSRYRVERDSLGEKLIPAGAYWGIHTCRAAENFSVSDYKLYHFPSLIRGLVSVKLASARANHSVGVLDKQTFNGIQQACLLILDGAYFDEFIVNAVQGGAGTSSNMNANEIIANLALEILDRNKGEYDVVGPIEHVNRSQSTNDVYATAVRISIIKLARSLIGQMILLRSSFDAKSQEFNQILKTGRTQLQDAVPMTLGQEFAAFAVMVDEDITSLNEAISLLYEVNIGGTAIGTGINSSKGYAEAALRELRDITELPLAPAQDLIEATQDVGAFVRFSSVLKGVAVRLSKICNDLRLLSSGPRAGFGEIRLPAVQTGSSIMPGKVNPVIPELVNQVAFSVIGKDVTVSLAAEAGQLQLNAFVPIIAKSLLSGVSQLEKAIGTLHTKCIDGIEANKEQLAENALRSIGLATALNPYLGYDATSEIAQEALRTGRNVLDVVQERNLLKPEELDELLNPYDLIEALRYRD